LFFQKAFLPLQTQTEKPDGKKGRKKNKAETLAGIKKGVTFASRFPWKGEGKRPEGIRGANGRREVL
jgi:hypothetical protein